MTGTDITPDAPTHAQDVERLRRWRLVLGSGEADGIGLPLTGSDLRMDTALELLYGVERSGGLDKSSPKVARWLGDIREYFPSTVVQVTQKDAMQRLGLDRMLLEPEMLAAVAPDMNLVTTLLSLKRLIPAKTRETAREVVRKVARDLENRLAVPLRQAITGSLTRAVRNRRPRHNEIDWDRTIRANLRHYQAEYRTVIPETRIGRGRKGKQLRDVVLCIDQSGSMAASVVHAGIMSAVMATIPSIKTQVVVFDTSVVDLTDKLSDPVELLFGTQLGGGTDINQALTYCQGIITRPADTVLILISDLIEGGDNKPMLRRAGGIIASGVNMITLLSLDDHGAPAFSAPIAAALTELGSPCFACTPDMFPDLMAAALKKQDIAQWAARNNLVTSRGQ
jgi:hypothetical protein